MHAWRVVRIAAAGVLFLILLGLLGDAAEGLPLTRAAPTPFIWLGGLFLGGVASVVSSFLFEGADASPLETDHVADPLGRRVLRATLIGLATGAILIVILLRFVVR